jgi:phosphodiesterase/alkaline phosphatase D-like protein
MPGWTRREWLQGAGALGSAALVPGLGAGCSDVGAGTALVVEVEPTRALFAVWSSTASYATVEVRTGGVPIGRWEVRFGADGTGRVDATGLTPATAYRARITTSDGVELGESAFTTAPRDDDPRPVRIAVSADVDESPDYDSPIFDAVVAAAPELFVSLGDWPYADNGPPAITRGEYHDKYVQTRTAPRLDAWQRATSFRAIYDDHEFGNDWDGGDRLAEPARHEAALAAWDAWFPRRGDGPRYRRWRWGASLECFLLDCRTFRSAAADPDVAGKTLLGDEQRAWLFDGLRTSTAAFCVVFTSVPLDFGHGVDHWAGYTTERDAIFDALRTLDRPGVLFVSADQHWFAAHRHRYGLRELQVGPLARGLIAQPTSRPPGVITRDSQYNFGLIEVDATPRLTFRAVGATGLTFYTESFTPEDLRPRGA